MSLEHVDYFLNLAFIRTTINFELPEHNNCRDNQLGKCYVLCIQCKVLNQIV